MWGCGPDSAQLLSWKVEEGRSESSPYCHIEKPCEDMQRCWSWANKQEGPQETKSPSTLLCVSQPPELWKPHIWSCTACANSDRSLPLEPWLRPFPEDAVFYHFKQLKRFFRILWIWETVAEGMMLNQYFHMNLFFFKILPSHFMNVSLQISLFITGLGDRSIMVNQIQQSYLSQPTCQWR